MLEGKIIPRKELPHKGLSCLAFSKKEVNSFVRGYQGPRPEVVKSFKFPARFLLRRYEQSSKVYTKGSSLQPSLWNEGQFDSRDIMHIARTLFSAKNLRFEDL